MSFLTKIFTKQLIPLYITSSILAAVSVYTVNQYFQIQELESDVRFLEREINSIFYEIEDVKSEVKKNEYQPFDEALILFEELESKIENLKDEVYYHSSQISNMEWEIIFLEGKIRDIEYDVDDLQ